MDDEPKMLFVQDALPFRGGAEKVLEAALEAFPDADIRTLIYREEAFRGTPIGERRVQASLLNRLPGAQSHHRAFLPLMPLAIETLDLRGYDVIISFSYAVAHGIRPGAGQLHVSYVHTPMRYAWQARRLGEEKLKAYPAPVRWAGEAYLSAFRHWDISAASRVQRFLTVSEWMAGCIWQAYRRRADVLYPPVDLSGFQPLEPRGGSYVILSRLVAHKRVDLAVEAFNRLGRPLLVIGDGPELPHLRRLAGPGVRLTGWQPQEEVARCLGGARALIHVGEEDFGIAMAEAQAAGCPVIAYGRGAAREIVQEGQTGLFFEEQTAESLAEAIVRFEQREPSFDPRQIRQNAQRFGRQRFIEGFASLIRAEWQNFRQHSAAEDRETRFRRLPRRRLAGKG
jgi:glycosyltransferase involved in cell wall biosynthesis